LGLCTHAEKGLKVSNPFAEVPPWMIALLTQLPAVQQSTNPLVTGLTDLAGLAWPEGNPVVADYSCRRRATAKGATQEHVLADLGVV
jgi:hypothetical protein